MGKHTHYWQAYARAQSRAVLPVVAAILLWVGAVVAAVAAQDTLGELFPYALALCFAGLAVSIVALAWNAYRVVCPECGSVYRRHKWGGQCPVCGLRLLQDDPA